MAYVYDGLNRWTLALQNYRSSLAATPDQNVRTEFTYDAQGNRLAMTDGLGTTSWTYDLAGHPLTMTAPLTGSLSYRYDRLGNRTQLIYPDGKIVTGTFTGLNQMTGLTDWQTQASGFAYNANGQPLTTTLPNGVTGAYGYDTAHRLTGLSYTNLTGTVGIYTYTLDARGNWQTAQEALLVPGGSITETKAISYTYDHLYRATDVVYSLGIEFHYQFDAAGNVLTRTKILLGLTTVTTYTYDAGNELVTSKSDDSSTVWHYAYDNNGSLTDVTPNGSPSNGARRYTYDAARQLTKGEQHDGTAYQLLSEMAYDGLSQRRLVIAWAGGISVTTTYVVDPAQNGAVLAATSGGQTTYYVQGPTGPLAELTTSWGYYLADGQGSVRQLTDATGAVTLQRRYSPWGEILDQEGTGDFAWGYLGGLMDAASGLIYVGARQYFDPATELVPVELRGRHADARPTPTQRNKPGRLSRTYGNVTRIASWRWRPKPPGGAGCGSRKRPGWG
jgi:YD repeat-containing protein